VKTVEELVNLFLSGRIVKAVMTGWERHGKAAITAVAESVWAVVQPVINWAAKKDVKLEFATVKIEVKESGGE
jgi:hypothetical protein